MHLVIKFILWSFKWMVTLNKILSLTHMRTKKERKPVWLCYGMHYGNVQGIGFSLAVIYMIDFAIAFQSQFHLVSTFCSTPNHIAQWHTHTLFLSLFCTFSLTYMHLKRWTWKKMCGEKITERKKSRKNKFHGEFTPVRSMPTSQLWY